MKKLFCLLFALGLLLTGCSFFEKTTENTDELPPEAEHSEQEILPPMEISVAFLERQESLTSGQMEVIQKLIGRWYHFIGSFEEEDFSELFDADARTEALQHAASCRTLVAIRQAALEDLRMTRCAVTLTVTEVSDSGGEVRIELDENTVMQFAGLDVESELFDLPHIFKMRNVGGDEWVITHHEADDNPYFSFTYQEGCGTDPNLPVFLRNIERRQLLRGETAQVSFSCDHPYDRQAALAYMTEYCAHRNGAWYAYDDVGGNCMNFGSQILLAGGIPMDYEGDAKWYWESVNRTDLPFINVGEFVEYARTNRGFGLVADMDAGYYTGEVGDLLIFGVNSSRHTTAICGFVKDGEGNVIDYLLCSNTTNYRNFPAGAYYYTGQRLVKIYGWNE